MAMHVSGYDFIVRICQSDEPDAYLSHMCVIQGIWFMLWQSYQTCQHTVALEVYESFLSKLILLLSPLDCI